MDANGWEENRSKIENNVESYLDSEKAYSICDLKKDFFKAQKCVKSTSKKA